MVSLCILLRLYTFCTLYKLFRIYVSL